MSRQITKEMAQKIADKLEGQIDVSPASHDVVKIFDGNTKVAQFGLRRGSEKDLGHDHIPKELQCSTRFCKELAWCTKSRADYLAEIADD